MAKKPLPSPEVLRQLLRYEPETGKLFWKERGPEWFSDNHRPAHGRASAWNTRYAHEEAFTTTDADGYLGGKIFKRTYRAHRVAWAIATGAWPESQIDHINGEPSDNRLENLREATNQQNQYNRGSQQNNGAGFKGVTFRPLKAKWQARIVVNGKYRSLGYYKTPAEAHAAYCVAAEKLHGVFSRTA